jgi:phosphohistidine phosphatase
MEEAPPGKELLLLRHAKASRDGKEDFERALTKRGRRDAPRIGRWMKSEGLSPDLVITSPSRRTRETTDLVLAEIGIEADARLDERVYDADVPMLLAVLAECPAEARRVLVVGHNPGLEGLVRHLGGDTAREPEKGKFLPTSALARLSVASSWAGLAAGAAPVVAIVSWSRKEGRWRVRHGTEPPGG